MLRKTAVLSTLLGVVNLLSCSDDDGPGQFRYPLRNGLEWHYTRTLTRTTDTSTYVDYEFTTSILVGSTRTFGVDGEAIALDVTEAGYYYGSQFVQNRDEGFYSIAYCGTPPVVTPKRGIQSMIGGDVFQALMESDLLASESCEDMSITRNPDRPLVLPYPIRTGADWLYRKVPGLEWEIRKVNRGWDTVRVGAGLFPAYQIEWYYINGPRNISLVDDICSQGLIRRTLIVDSVRVTDYQHPAEPGVYETWIEVLSLDSLRR